MAGAQLFAGDTLAAGEGSAVLIYLSGRTVEVPSGGRHPVGGEMAQAPALMGRVMETLAEVAGPRSEAQGPVVHGMARAFGAISGAMPANTRVSRTDFTFCWDPVEEAAEYAFALEDTAGRVLARKVVQGTSLSAAQVGVKAGGYYVWSVSRAGGALSTDSGKLWLQVASAADSPSCCCSRPARAR